jgi:hypothetical protein
MADFADGGLIRERSFVERLSALNPDDYRGQEVLIQGCAGMPIPTWAFMMVAARVSQAADRVTFGEKAAPMVVFEREG